MAESRLFVGNLPWSSNENDLKETFSQVGVVVKANIVIDRETGRSRGFGFVEMATPDEAKKACESFNGFTMSGRAIKVDIATEKKPRTEFRPEPRQHTESRYAPEPSYVDNTPYEQPREDRYSERRRFKERR